MAAPTPSGRPASTPMSASKPAVAPATRAGRTRQVVLWWTAQAAPKPATKSKGKSDWCQSGRANEAEQLYETWFSTLTTPRPVSGSRLSTSGPEHRAGKNHIQQAVELQKVALPAQWQRSRATATAWQVRKHRQHLTPRWKQKSKCITGVRLLEQPSGRARAPPCHMTRCPSPLVGFE